MDLTRQVAVANCRRITVRAGVGVQELKATERRQRKIVHAGREGALRRCRTDRHGVRVDLERSFRTVGEVTLDAPTEHGRGKAGTVDVDVLRILEVEADIRSAIEGFGAVEQFRTNADAGNVDQAQFKQRQAAIQQRLVADRVEVSGHRRPQRAATRVGDVRATRALATTRSCTLEDGFKRVQVLTEHVRAGSGSADRR